MIGYNELYEILRKEKYSETLQQLPKNFLLEFKEYITENKKMQTNENDLFSDATAKAKKQYENSFALFRELMIKRKRKLLNLIFVATETGIMKRDYENMLDIEKETFDMLVKNFEHADKKVAHILNGQTEKKQEHHKMIIINKEVEEFIDAEGKTIGPFKPGDLINLSSQIADILVRGEKARFVDEH